MKLLLKYLRGSCNLSAYSEKRNIEYANNNKIKLVAKLNLSVTQGYRKKEDEFELNKDAGMYVCKAGHMAIKKFRQGEKGVAVNQTDTYIISGSYWYGNAGSNGDI